MSLTYFSVRQQTLGFVVEKSLGFAVDPNLGVF